MEKKKAKAIYLFFIIQYHFSFKIKKEIDIQINRQIDIIDRDSEKHIDG